MLEKAKITFLSAISIREVSIPNTPYFIFLMSAQCLETCVCAHTLLSLVVDTTITMFLHNSNNKAGSDHISSFPLSLLYLVHIHSHKTKNNATEKDFLAQIRKHHPPLHHRLQRQEEKNTLTPKQAKTGSIP